MCVRLCGFLFTWKPLSNRKMILSLIGDILHTQFKLRVINKLQYINNAIFLKTKASCRGQIVI